MKVALVHDWLTGMRGGEKVLEIFCELYPEADIYTLIHFPGSVSKTIESHRIRTSFLQSLPLVRSKYRHYLPLMPAAVRGFDLSGYDLVISTSHCVAKGARAGHAHHISCCFTPMRYIWDQYEQYFAGAAWHVRWPMAMLRGALQRWDVRTAGEVDDFIAISRFVAERIRRHYGRESTVIYPHVDEEFYTPGPGAPGDFDLIVSALVPYKRIDVAIDAYNANGRKLRVVGSGPETERLKARARPNIEFLGWRSDSELRDLYRSCRALIFPGIEDYGIVPLEAMACGRPVIGLGQGGLLETVVPDRTGVLYDRMTPDALNAAIRRSETGVWDAGAIRAHAERFGKARYRRELKDFIDSRLSQSAGKNR